MNPSQDSARSGSPSRVHDTLRRMVRRFVVPRQDYDSATEALREALSLIVKHHDCSKRVELGQVCPHCADDTGASPVLDRIYREIQKANQAIASPCKD